MNEVSAKSFSREPSPRGTQNGNSKVAVEWRGVSSRNENTDVKMSNPMMFAPNHSTTRQRQPQVPPSPSPAEANERLLPTRSGVWNSISSAVNDLKQDEGSEKPENEGANSLGVDESTNENSETTVSFDAWRFMRTFLYHALYPVSLPILAWYEGFHYLRSMSFLSLAPKDIINSHIFPIMLLFTNIVVAGGFSSLSKGGPTMFEVVMVDLYYLFRILVIGIKYATLSDKLYNDMGYRPPKEGQEINAQNMLVTGWMNPPRAYVEDEILSEESRKGFNLTNSLFKVDGRLHCYLDKIFQEEELWDTTSSVSTLQKGAISAVCAGKSRSSVFLNADGIRGSGLFGEASARQITLALWLQNMWPSNFGIAIILQVFLTTMFRVVTPVVVAKDFNRLSQLGSSPLDLIPRIFIMIVGSHVQFSLLTFLMIGILDFHRRHQVSSCLTALSRNTKITYSRRTRLDEDIRVRYKHGYLELMVPKVDSLQPKQTSLPPVLDLSIAENAFSWYRLRLILRHTGRRFSLRLQIYVTVMLIILLGMNIIFLVRFLTQGWGAFVGQFESILLLAEVIYMNIAILSFVILMIVHGILANSEMETQNEIFVKALVKLEELRREYPEDSPFYKELNSTLQALRTVKDAVQIDDTQSPVQIFGVRASPILLRGMAAGILTVISAIIGRLQMTS
eukprot:gb/GECG01003980.1/.p1 GENE.gb/GECG01003980.1/~~gb/GECG01003980.1/.p1  ORF type:complete len:678 (+),score=48.24 gb/GECG01003980.1/:1-2034(+)